MSTTTEGVFALAQALCARDRVEQEPCEQHKIRARIVADRLMAMGYSVVQDFSLPANRPGKK